VRHIEDQHLQLAQFYSRNGLNNKAFKEYYALIKMHPYISDLYYDAVQYLLSEEKYNEAIQLIESAPLMKKDYYYYYMIGTIQFKIGKTKQSIENLNYAYKIITPEAKPTLILIPLYVIYKSINDKENELQVLKLIQKYDPNFKPKVEGENSIIKTKISVDELYKLATDQVKQGEVTTAIEMLLVADKFEENFKVKKLLATLYFTQGDTNFALEYSMAANAINPNDFDNLNNLFLLHLRNGNLDNSYDILMQMKSLNVNSEKINKLNEMYEQKKIEGKLQQN
jgi:tetratricopeptide (TPR) repeat protein